MTTNQDLIDQLAAISEHLKSVDQYHDGIGAQKQIGLYLDTMVV